MEEKTTSIIASKFTEFFGIGSGLATGIALVAGVGTGVMAVVGWIADAASKRREEKDKPEK